MSNKIYIGTEEIGGSGGSADLSNYYNKSHIDSSYGVIDASLKYLDASVKELASRPSGGGNISKLSDLTNDCDFRPITYITKDDYDDLVEAETLDDDTMYVITDLAVQEDLSTFVTIEDLNTAKAQINASLSSTANTIITEANTSINYWKTTACEYTNTSTNYWKTQAINAVQSQQTTSVDAITSAKNSAISDINSAADAKIATISDYSYSKSYIDSSYGVVDSSLKAFDASIKELAARPSGGGGGTGGGISQSDLENYAYSKSYIDTSINYVTTYTADVSSRIPIFEYNSATQTLNIIT